MAAEVQDQVTDDQVQECWEEDDVVSQPPAVKAVELKDSSDQDTSPSAPEEDTPTTPATNGTDLTNGVADVIVHQEDAVQPDEAPASPVVPVKVPVLLVTSEISKDEVEKEVQATRPVLPKASMTTMIDTDTVRAAYEDVRSDTSDTEWAVFKFRDQTIFCSAVGVGFEGFRNCFNDDERAFGYIRIQMGDEISKRQKFIFVTWVGPNVAVLRRAKMSIDKAMVKGIVKSFAVELQLETLAEVDAEYFRDQLSRAGGANYGTGVSRDL